MFALAIIGLVLNAVSTRFVEPGTTTYGVIQVNFIGLTVLALFSGGILLMCHREL
jgi:hypothetical protein